jgi:hypothetical protein
MTLEELNQIIERALDRRLQHMFKPQDTRTTAELLTFIEKHRIVPSPDSKSAREMLREDRDA